MGLSQVRFAFSVPSKPKKTAPRGGLLSRSASLMRSPIAIHEGRSRSIHAVRAPQFTRQGGNSFGSRSLPLEGKMLSGAKQMRWRKATDWSGSTSSGATSSGATRHQRVCRRIVARGTHRAASRRVFFCRPGQKRHGSDGTASFRRLPTAFAVGKGGKCGRKIAFLFSDT